jgi:hypothetical protein
MATARDTSETREIRRLSRELAVLRTEHQKQQVRAQEQDRQHELFNVSQS